MQKTPLIKLNFPVQIIAVLLLSGCVSFSATENLSEAKKALPFTPADKYSNFSDNLKPQGQVNSLQEWVRLSENSDLIALMQKALKNNSTISIAQSNLNKAESLRESAARALLPNVSVGLAKSNIRKTESKPAKTRSYKSNVGVSWELDVFGKNINGYQAVSYSALSAKAQLHHNQQTVLGQLVRSFILANGSGLRLIEAQKNLQVLKQKQKIFEMRYQGGNGLVDSLAQIELETIQIGTTIRNIKMAESSAIRQIQVLIGEYPNGKRSFSLDLPLSHTDLKITPPASLLANRPDVAASYIALLSKRADVAYAFKNKWLPSLRFSADGSTSSSLLEDVLSNPNIWSLGVNLIKNIFSNVEEHQLTLAKEDEAQALVNYVLVVSKAFEEAENALQQENNAKQNQTSAKRSLSLADKLFKLADNRYKSGIIDAQTWIERQASLFTASQQLLSAQENWLSSQINVLMALGISDDNVKPALKKTN